MIRDDELPELQELRRIETEFPFRIDPSLGDQVIATTNDSQPVHRWFKFKESFSPTLFETIVRQLYPTGLPNDFQILDPFVGVGTTLLAAELVAANNNYAQVRAVGIERNPFIHFAANTKIHWGQIETRNLLRLGARAIDRSEGGHADLPELSSIRTGRCISQYVSTRLITIKQAIQKDTSGATANALLLGLAASIEPLSKVRKDGRALRIVKKPRARIQAVLEEKWAQIKVDCETLASRTLSARFQRTLINGDGRDLKMAGIGDETVDLVFTSPPYPNNIDYTEVYKLELWLLGFVRSQEAFLSLRKTTFRSHPTCAEPTSNESFDAQLRSGTVDQLLSPVLRRAEAQPWRHRLFQGYFSDMWQTLQECHRCLRKGGYAVFVVGNSLHGGAGSAYLVPTDLAIAGMARSLGFVTNETIIARNLKRRLSGNHFLRESVVIVRKPDA